MKKLILICLTIIFTLSFSACSSSTLSVPDLESGESLPWFSLMQNVSYEYVEYSVQKYYGGNSEDDEYKLLSDESSFSLYITQGENSNKDIICTLVSTLTVVYNNNAYNGENAGKTDKITSTALFRADDLTAISTTKTAVLQTAPHLDYTINVDYSLLTASYTCGTETKTFDSSNGFKKGSYVDNEYLYYYIRAMKDMGDSLSETFNLMNWYENFLNNEVKTHQFSASYQGKLALPISEDLLVNFDSANKDSNNKTISCNIVSAGLTATEKGPLLYLGYTIGSNTTTDSENANVTYTSRKILAYMETYEYIPQSGSLAFVTQYKIKAISRDKQ